MNTNGIFYYAVLPGLFIQLIGAYLYFVLLDGSDIAHLFYTTTKILVLLWPTFWIAHTLSSKRKKLQKEQWTSVVFGLIFGLSVSVLMYACFIHWFDYFAELSHVFKEKAADLRVLDFFILFALFFSVIHSAIEEYYWRWFIFSGLQLKLSAIPAAIIASIGFTAHHIVVLSQFFDIEVALLFSFGVFIGGLVWCYIYKKTNTLLGSWISHVLIDLTIMSIGYILIFM